MEIVGQTIVLHYAPVFRLILGHDTVCTVVDPLHQVNRLAFPHILATLIVDDLYRHPQTDAPVDAALAAMIMLIICMQGMDFIAQEVSAPATRMGDERLFLTEFKCQFVSQERGELTLDVVCFGLWTCKPKQEVIAIPHIP